MGKHVKTISQSSVLGVDLLIFVTLGTQDKSFERLLKAIDRQIENGIIQEEVIVQAGYTKYESKNMKIFDLISSEKFEEYIEKCDVLITHGGVGSILGGLKKNKKIIAAARLEKYKEHTNDHQLQIVQEFAKEGYILELKDFNRLDKILQKVKTFHPKKLKSNNDYFINKLEKYIDGVEKETMINTLKKLFTKYKEIINYLIFGVLTTVINLIIYYLLVYTVLNPEIALQLQMANIISWICAVLFAYVTNRKYVFESKNANKLKEVTNFITARIATLLMDMAIMFIGVTILHGSDKIIKLISQVLVIVGNYILSKLFVFKKD